MPAWFLNRALTNFRSEVNGRWPNRDKTSDGTIGDAAHASRSSDHNPDPDGSVDAWDMDVDGVDVAACKAAFEAHEASSYWIHNDRISFRDEGWVPRSYAYAGPNRNRHDKHVHWNGRQSRENSTKPWFTEDDMALTPADAELVVDRLFARLVTSPGFPDGAINVRDLLKQGYPAKVAAEAARDGVAELVARPPAVPVELDYDLLAAALLRNIATPTT